MRRVCTWENKPSNMPVDMRQKIGDDIKLIEK